jgi:hypothetical protein
MQRLYYVNMIFESKSISFVLRGVGIMNVFYFSSAASNNNTGWLSLVSVNFNNSWLEEVSVERQQNNKSVRMRQFSTAAAVC